MLTKELLLSVTKPARYIGGEINVVKKDHSKIAVKVCLCFPDIYEIGMSHLGLRILYDVINAHADYVAERVFSPWGDMEERMKAASIPLWSLESGTAVKDFDILGFSLQYELSYTNVLAILSLAGIPLRSAERDGQFPLVLAGGACCFNPGPMAAFVDAFVIGEAEDVILEILEVYRQHKEAGKKDKGALLGALSVLEGVYVPSVFDQKKGKIKKRFVKDLDRILGFQSCIVPYLEIVHDRISVEIMRGCPHQCRFCQARSVFYPLRTASPEKILEACRRLYRQTGYDEISLLSLSSSDHPHLSLIVRRLMEEFRAKGVSIALPSVRAKLLVGELSSLFALMRKTSLTFAPEAGTERLRHLIRKNIDIAELQEVARQAYRAGYRMLKCYFMIGLPTETPEDLDGIAALCQQLAFLKKEVNGGVAHINVSISNFVPKPHTPFQWQGMVMPEEIRAKQDYLGKQFKKMRGFVHVKFHEAHASFVEAVLSRGDERLAGVIEAAFQKGSRFDSWNQMLNYPRWLEAFDQCGLDPRQYLKAKSYADVLSWGLIDVGISTENLAREARLALIPKE